jgi:hypothetical protein
MRVVIHGRVGTTSLEKSELSPQHGENSALFESAREFDQESAAFGKTNCSSDDAYSLFKARCRHPIFPMVKQSCLLSGSGCCWG